MDIIERLEIDAVECYDDAIKEIESLRAKLAAAEKDAERYRLLRRVTSEPALVELLEYLDNNPDTPEKFDAFIDAAIAKEKELTRCASNRDGECSHKDCPQNRDGEPLKSGRHCPLDNWDKD